VQAQAFLTELYEQVATVSRKIEVAERRCPRLSARGQAFDRQVQSSLRRELYEVHRLIDGIHRRFPETLPTAVRERQSRATG
jgi:hypothetical protein